MSITYISIIAAIGFVAALSAGIWLFLHLTSVASAFAGNADLVEARKRPRHSKAKVLASVIIMIAGAVGCVVLALTSM
ncbi:hypothetical protein [Croceicoccus gelatinilyticus]|uniref:hypothetical protein n=1 Tax=Croceicoccus gelatinilyticus TaxID=2835536 RepID=UPI001BCF59FE|nr:hypothetical protein [Croceicoccus gelatinilyticus]MBS7668140.1 hypothetical protein [Croceicoccus gelatinilyticus]